MLRAEAWRQVPALVTERGVIEVHEDVDTVWQLRTPPLGAAIPELITRTRRVWLVGPDAKGWLSFRVDGSRSPLPARRTRVSVASVAREPASPGTTGTAADDPVAALMARDLRRTLLRVLWGPVLALPIIAALVAGLSMMTRSATGWFVLGVLLVALLVPGETNRWRAGHDIRAVPALLAAGPWQRIAIQLDGWNAPQNSTLATANGTVQLGDGTSLELTITASVSLLGNIDETGTAWIAGEPAPGRKRAVGIPGYPLLGVVAFS